MARLRSIFSVLGFLAVMTGAGMALTGCADTNQVSFVRLSMDAPPPAQIEDVPELNNPPTETWRPGYWAYTGADFYWVPGEVIPRPSETAIWIADHWEQRGYGWAFVPGVWR
ncbi:MAG: YXWGXW repeat-containing protein [Alphaproteobacteria bacterium]|nr:YXWGXW repeat-containing protein [Alphaproteobacteria bacterium]MBV8548148.1 YXWGXW repeat-containing protein [Alphaproteobacteria bacterium]